MNNQHNNFENNNDNTGKVNSGFASSAPTSEELDSIEYILPVAKKKKSHKKASHSNSPEQTKDNAIDDFVYAQPYNKKHAKKKKGLKIFGIIMGVIAALLVICVSTILIFNQVGKSSMHNYDELNIEPPVEQIDKIETVENDGKTIKYNGHTYSFNEKVTSVVLMGIDIDEKEMLLDTEIGAADIYFTEISDGTITRMSGKRQEINLNNLVYIGINQNYAPLNQLSLRHAISSAVDRVKFCEKAYYNNAKAANGFFHPFWKETNSVQNLEINANNQITIENLEEIGYNKLNSEGLRVNKNGIPLKFTLLVNSENRIRVMAANVIADQLKSVGIGITVVEKPYSQYISALSSGSFQLYLGEIKITDNMDLSPLLIKGGSAAYGLPNVSTDEKEDKNESDTETAPEVKPQDTSSQKVLEEFYKGNATVRDVASVLQTDMAVVPLCYRTGLLFYNSCIKNVKNSSLGDIYFSIESYSIN